MKPEMKNNILLKSALALAIVDLVLIAAILLQVNNLVKDVLEAQNKQMEIGVMKEGLEKVEKARIEEEKTKETAEIEDSLTIDPETGWQVYKNGNFGYEIKVPKDFKVTLTNTIQPSGYRSINIFSNRKGVYLKENEMEIAFGFYSAEQTSLQDWFQKNVKAESGYSEKLGNKTVKINNTTFLERPAIIQEIFYDKPIEGSSGLFKYLFFVYQNKIYTITTQLVLLDQDDERLKTLDQILSTLKFIK